jgi:hypothetical protein
VRKIDVGGRRGGACKVLDGLGVPLWSSSGVLWIVLMRLRVEVAVMGDLGLWSLLVFSLNEGFRGAYLVRDGGWARIPSPGFLDDLAEVLGGTSPGSWRSED